MIEIEYTIVTAVISGTFAVIINEFKKRRLSKLQAERNKIIAELRKASESIISKDWTILYSFPEHSVSTIATEKEMKESAAETIEALDERIRNIESRLPSDSTIDKISSVNDAILATSLESLTARIEALEKKMLTKWDVAKVVFGVFGFIAAIIAILSFIMNFILQ
jgi:glycerol-3-phosphate cytidylyltransferase-like family protein